jgi:hypothetical protein
MYTQRRRCNHISKEKNREQTVIPHSTKQEEKKSIAIEISMIPTKPKHSVILNYCRGFRL